MMCGPVLTQWFALSGFVAYGSVLLASVPPDSMYMNPTLPVGGGLCPTHASTHAIAFLSAHIGSGPGVSGLSGMHVNAFVPLRNVCMPLSSIVTIVAFFATAAGAALIALAISCFSLGAFFAAAAFSAANALAAVAARSVAAIRRNVSVMACMSTSPQRSRE